MIRNRRSRIGDCSCIAWGIGAVGNRTYAAIGGRDREIAPAQPSEVAIGRSLLQHIGSVESGDYLTFRGAVGVQCISPAKMKMRNPGHISGFRIVEKRRNIMTNRLCVRTEPQVTGVVNAILLVWRNAPVVQSRDWRLFRFSARLSPAPYRADRRDNRRVALQF